jgi:hypothetical protein
MSNFEAEVNKLLEITVVCRPKPSSTAVLIQLNNQIIFDVKKLLSLKPVVRTRRSCKRVGLMKQQNSFQGLVMYGHEVLMSLQMRTKFFGSHFSHGYVRDIGLGGE